MIAKILRLIRSQPEHRPSELMRSPRALTDGSPGPCICPINPACPVHNMVIAEVDR